MERQLTRIENEADRLEQLIARILKLVRLERPAQRFPGCPVDVGKLLETITEDVGIEAEARSRTVSVRITGVLEVSGDPELLRNAFENVIRNAVRYGPSGSVVGVTAGREDWIQVTVRDHGPASRRRT